MTTEEILIVMQSVEGIVASEEKCKCFINGLRNAGWDRNHIALFLDGETRAQYAMGDYANGRFGPLKQIWLDEAFRVEGLPDPVAVGEKKETVSE